MITALSIGEIRDRTDLVATIRKHVVLREHGRRFVGCCPFHDDETGAFNVNPSAALWHCFGCKESGDVFTFLERVTGRPFDSVVRELADKAGVAA